MSGVLTRFPCSANKNACPRGCRRLDGKSCLPCLLGSRICHKSHAIQFIICAPDFRHAKRPLLPCYLADKRSLVVSIYSVSVYAKITKLYSPLVGWLVGWLVARIVPIIYIFITIYHVRVHFLSKIYIPILPQSEVIVKWYFFRSCGRIFGCS